MSRVRASGLRSVSELGLLRDLSDLKVYKVYRADGGLLDSDSWRVQHPEAY